MSIRTDSANRLDNGAFKGQVSTLTKNAQELWALLTTLAIQAICHYHEHSYDVSRVKYLFEAVASTDLGSMESALRKLINTATGINMQSWKHSSAKLQQQKEPWEEVIDRVEVENLRSFSPSATRAARGTVERVKQDAKDTSKQLARAIDGIESKAVQDRLLQIVNNVKGQSESEALASLNPADAESVFGEMPADLRLVVEEIIANFSAMCELGGKEGYKVAMTMAKAYLQRVENAVEDQFHGFKDAVNAELDAAEEAEESESDAAEEQLAEAS